MVAVLNMNLFEQEGFGAMLVFTKVEGYPRPFYLLGLLCEIQIALPL
jgi:hypothetical protein